MALYRKTITRFFSGAPKISFRLTAPPTLAFSKLGALSFRFRKRHKTVNQESQQSEAHDAYGRRQMADGSLKGTFVPECLLSESGHSFTTSLNDHRGSTLDDCSATTALRFPFPEATASKRLSSRQATGYGDGARRRPHKTSPSRVALTRSRPMPSPTRVEQP